MAGAQLRGSIAVGHGNPKCQSGIGHHLAEYENDVQQAWTDTCLDSQGMCPLPLACEGETVSVGTCADCFEAGANRAPGRVGAPDAQGGEGTPTGKPSRTGPLRLLLYKPCKCRSHNVGILGLNSEVSGRT